MTTILHVGKCFNADYPICFPSDCEVQEIDIASCDGAYAVAELVNQHYIKLKKYNKSELLVFIPLIPQPCSKKGGILGQLDILVEIRINSYYFNRKTTVDSMINGAKIVMYSTQGMEFLFRTYPVFGTVTTPGTFFLQINHIGSWDYRKAKLFSETLIPAPNQLVSAFKTQLIRELDPQLHNQRHGNANIFGAYIMLNIMNQLQGQPLQLRDDLLPPSLRKALFVYNRRLDKLELGHYRKIAMSEISTIKEQLARHNFKIGLVDDEGQQFRLEKASRNYTGFGWTHVFNRILATDADTEEGVMVDLLALDQEKPDSARNILKKFQLLHSGMPQKNNKRVIKELALRIIRNIRNTGCCCLLLDVYLKSQKENGNIMVCSGTQLLAELRRIMPAFPIIVVTAVNKPWKHRRLMEMGADAVWVKEGIDEKQLPEDSVHNFVRLFELIRKMTGPEYQFLSRVGLQIHRLKKNPRLWWRNAYHFLHRDPKRTLSNFKLQDPFCIIRILNGCLLEIRRFLLDFQLNMLSSELTPSGLPQSLIDQEDYFVKSMIRDLSQIIEVVHGKKFDPGYQLNSQDIGGRIQGGTQFHFGRGDWFGFGLYQHRNECSHYFPEITYSFSDHTEGSRNLMYFMAHLLAYLSSEEEPYCSFDLEDLLQTKAPAISIICSGYMDWLLYGKKLLPGGKKHHDNKRKLEAHREIYQLIRYGK